MRLCISCLRHMMATHWFNCFCFDFFSSTCFEWLHIEFPSETKNMVITVASHQHKCKQMENDKVFMNLSMVKLDCQHKNIMYCCCSVALDAGIFVVSNVKVTFYIERDSKYELTQFTSIICYKAHAHCSHLPYSCSAQIVHIPWGYVTHFICIKWSNIGFSCMTCLYTMYEY